MPLPAMSGALPWIGSYSACRLPDACTAPSVAEGSMPRLPVSIEARSDSRSPNRFEVTITSNCRGLRTNCMAQLSAYMCDSSTSGNSRSRSAVTVWRQNRPDCITLAFSTLRHAVLPLARQFEGDAGDALDLAGGVGFGVEAALLAVGQRLDAARFAEIDAAGAFADDHQVQAADDVGLQRGGVDQRVQHDRGAQIGEQVEFLAQPQDGQSRGEAGSRVCPISARRPSRTGWRRRPWPSASSRR